MPIKYIPYTPNTVEGQAILDNLTRTRRVLRYRDNDKVYDRIKRGLPLYEVEKNEIVGENSKNLIIRGECLSACAYLKDKDIKVDLVYIDPPFASGADYAKKVYIRRNPKLAEKIAKAEEQLDIEELRSFEEKMYGDIWNKEDYLNWMYENLFAIKSVMSDTASIYVHLDWHIGHYVKILMDEVFGEENFRNEIVWRKSNSHNDGNRFGNITETIFYYSISDNSIYNRQYYEVDIKSYNLVEEETGRKYKSVSMNAAGSGDAKYFGDTLISPPNGTHWRWSQERINSALSANPPKIYFSENGVPRYKQYLDEMEGNPIQNLWNDFMAIPSQSSERVDYATQKPEALLQRIISASSNEGMVVADFFGGSGVTAKVANDLKRNFIHVDVGINSIQTTRDRLKATNANFEILDVKDGVSLFRNPVQTMDKLKSLITGLRNEDQLDKFWEGAINDSKLGLVPVYIPNLLDHSTKVLDIPLMNRIINEAVPDLPDNTKQVIVYYIDIDNEKELLKFIDEYNNTETKIVLRDLKVILDEVVINDIVGYEIRHFNSKDTEAQGMNLATLCLSGEEFYEVEITKFISDRLLQKINEYNQKKGLNKNDYKTLNELTDDEVEIEETDEKPKKTNFKPIEISETGLELIELISIDCTTTAYSWTSDCEIKIDKNGYLITDSKKSKDFWDGKITCNKKPLRMKIRNIAGDETIVDFK